MVELQKYLTGADPDAHKVVGEPLRLERAGSRYESRARVLYQSARDAAAAMAAVAGKPVDPKAPGQDAAWKNLGELQGAAAGDGLTFAFEQTARPGIYLVELMQRAGDMGGEARPEPVAFAYNVDTAKESDLRRAPTDELEKYGKYHAPEVGSLAGLVDPHRDLSESPWIYLLFLVVLVAEQALAVHLSFHLKANEGPLPVPAARPQPAAA
jgi:hypothetical protein